MANQKLTPLQETEAKRRAAAAAKVNKQPRIFSEAEKATRKERVGKAKDALARSVGTKGDHVTAGRAALKKYLQNMKEPNQPDDERFEMLIEAPLRRRRRSATTTADSEPTGAPSTRCSLSAQARWFPFSQAAFSPVLKRSKSRRRPTLIVLNVACASVPWKVS